MALKKVDFSIRLIASHIGSSRQIILSSSRRGELLDGGGEVRDARLRVRDGDRLGLVVRLAPAGYLAFSSQFPTHSLEIIKVILKKSWKIAITSSLSSILMKSCQFLIKFMLIHVNPCESFDFLSIFNNTGSG